MDCANSDAQGQANIPYEEWQKGTSKPTAGIIEVLDVSLRADSGAVSRSIGEMRASVSEMHCVQNR
jgi:hypothetical protein